MSIKQFAQLVCIVVCATPCLGQWVTQSVPLQTGWNGIHLSVQPYPATCEAQFAGLPIESVQRHNLALSTAQFITDPTELFARDDEWLSWQPDVNDSGYVNTLRNIIGGTTYLILATNNCTWVATGRPVLPRLKWEQDAFNMVGFQVSLDSENQPTVADFFKNVPAINGERGVGEERVFLINTDLKHKDITGQTAQLKIESGKAYWIKAQGTSRYAGGLHVYTADPDGLAFGVRHNELRLFVRNDYGEAMTLTMRHAVSEHAPAGYAPVLAAVPLLQFGGDLTNRQWTSWPVEQSQSFELEPNETLTLRLGVNRNQMSAPDPTNGTWQSILKIESSCGSFVRVPISTDYGQASEQFATWPAGLWVGEAALSAVSFVAFDEATSNEVASAPQPASDVFPLRLILHVGSDGQSQLLSRAMLAAETLPDSNVVYRIYTDEGDVPTTAKNVIRISSPAFGLVAPATLSGVGFGQSLSGAYVMDYDDPTNPFKHVYHPSHDNRKAEDGSVLSEGIESYSVSNQVDLAWGPATENGQGATLWSPDEMTTGTYTHVISNLRQVPITVRGPFSLQRVSQAGETQ
jgi:hypothetical protein